VLNAWMAADARYRFIDAKLREVWGLLLELAGSRDKGWLARSAGDVTAGCCKRSLRRLSGGSRLRAAGSLWSTTG
jgi:hypothetical protein